MPAEGLELMLLEVDSVWGLLNLAKSSSAGQGGGEGWGRHYPAENGTNSGSGQHADGTELLSRCPSLPDLGTAVICCIAILHIKVTFTLYFQRSNLLMSSRPKIIYIF